MSKIALEGNASGTGTFTIAGPNTNTNYTITLPQETGTLFTTGATTGLNASALSTGTVATARLASGTANSSTYLRGDQTWASISGGYSGPNATVYASGSGTFTIPSGITRLKVTVIGGGGGGGNRTDGGGGGGGGAAIKWLTSVTPGNTLAYSVGAGGAADNTGSTSSVSSGTQSITTISATGGTSSTGIGCGVGGAGSGGDLNISGNAGAYRGYNDGNSGGGSLYAGGGAGANNAGGGRQAGQPYGGGGGAQNAGATGVIVFEY
jgi:hypothetical protein